jgi:NAD(P)-dependent dehydrogenase (short-subunit alcohol dehydrogenase family)
VWLSHFSKITTGTAALKIGLRKFVVGRVYRLRNRTFAREHREKQMLQSTPPGRIGNPREIATVVAFLASDHARWVTGSLIQAAGGMR